MADSTFPLTMASHGEVVKIVAIRAGWGLTRRLADMGVLPGTTVKVVRGHMPGPVVVEVKGSRLALGHGMAHKIMVET